MSEVREAVRSRYANAAKQLAVFNSLGSGPAGCCQADGPDCGCSGSYSADELKEIGLTESVSLGCGNPTMLAQLEREPRRTNDGPDQEGLRLTPGTKRALITQTWRLIRDYWPPDGRIAVVPAPLRSVAAARVYDAGGSALLRRSTFRKRQAQSHWLRAGRAQLHLPETVAIGFRRGPSLHRLQHHEHRG